MNIREEITNRIIAAIEAGTPPWRKGWSSGELCINANTNKLYQGINQILLGMAGYSDERFLTFKQARKMGLHVRKGEKSTKIIRMVEVDRRAAEADKDGEIVSDEQGKVLVMRLYDVFNAEQIEGMEPRPARDHAIQPIDMAEAMVDGMKTTGLSVKHGFRGASYAIDDDLVRMPEMADFHKTENYYFTLLHECMHATGAYKRLNRLVPTARFGSPAYAREELRAELGAILCCQSIGIGTISGTGMAQEHIDNHASYIASWLQALKDDKNEIFKAAADAQRACDYIREHALKIEPKLVLVPEIVVPEVVVARRRGMRM